MIAFLPSGMLPSSTSTLASANTSAEADIVLRNSATEDLAIDVERTSMDPVISRKVLGLRWGRRLGTT
jgi:hypothetical protein